MNIVKTDDDMTQAEPVQGDDLERAVDQAIVACEGNTRATLRFP